MNFVDIVGFVFDLDGVIVDIVCFYIQVWYELVDQVQMFWMLELEVSFKGVGWMDFLELILKVGGYQGEYSQEEKVVLVISKNDCY